MMCQMFLFLGLKYLEEQIGMFVLQFNKLQMGDILLLVLLLPSQMEMMSKIGTMDKLLSHLPDSMFGGMGNLSTGQKRQMQNNLEKFRIIMDSMTQMEKDEPLLLKSSRIRRIARGSGATEKDVKELLAQWNRSRKMMRGMKGDRRFRRQMQSMMDFDDSELGMG